MCPCGRSSLYCDLSSDTTVTQLSVCVVERKMRWGPLLVQYHTGYQEQHNYCRGNTHEGMREKLKEKGRGIERWMESVVEVSQKKCHRHQLVNNIPSLIGLINQLAN